MSNAKFRGLAFSLLLLAALPACSDEPPADAAIEPSASPADADGWTAEQEAAYQACLERNMAVAMAWEIIEEQCRREVEGDVEGDGRPLDPVE